MPTRLLSRIVPRTLIAATVLLSVAAPASAKMVYRWKTDDGVLAFTDDSKRIPEKYRAQAKASPLRSLESYKRYTPAQRSATDAYAKRMEKSAREMSKLNARIPADGMKAPLGHYHAEPPADEAVLRIGESGRSHVEIETSGLGSRAPIVVEQKRYYVPGLNSTRRNTVIRQGGRILAVTKPLPHQQGLSDAEIPSETELDE